MSSSKGPGAFHLAAYLFALFIGGKYGWQLGSDFGGFLIGIVGAIVGALALSSLVGFVAHLLGSKVG